MVDVLHDGVWFAPARMITFFAKLRRFYNLKSADSFDQCTLKISLCASRIGKS